MMSKRLKKFLPHATVQQNFEMFEGIGFALPEERLSRALISRGITASTSSTDVPTSPHFGVNCGCSLDVAHAEEGGWRDRRRGETCNASGVGEAPQDVPPFQVGAHLHFQDAIGRAIYVGPESIDINARVSELGRLRDDAVTQAGDVEGIIARVEQEVTVTTGAQHAAF